MSIFFDFEVGKGGRRFRKAVDGDKYDIELFWDRESTDKLFGAVELGELIELSVLCICMINEKKEVVGFMALDDHPKVPGLDPAGWEIWMRNMFQRYYLSRNTLFIHFMCCKDSVSEYFLEEALVSVFLNDSYLLHIVILAPPDCNGDTLKKIMKRNIHKYFAKREDDEKMCHFMYTGLRQDFCPKLRMRRAVEEDNDDIVEILDKKCPRLKEIYGEYYISEIIGYHSESHRKVIVAEHQDQAIGVMCLNSEIDYKNLQKMYELSPYCGLMKPTPYEKEQNKRSNSLLNTFGDPIMRGKWGPFDCTEKLEDLHVDEMPSKANPNISKPKLSKVNFRKNAAMRRSFDHIMFRQQHSDDFSDKIINTTPASLTTDRSATNIILDDDPFDYEIVNIDNNLLTIPEALSCFNILQQTESTIQMEPTENFQRSKRRISMFKKLAAKKAEDYDEIKYHGGPNAFMIELYGLREDVDDRYAFDLLEAAFENMKYYDYCIIRLPSDEKSFPLLQHFCVSHKVVDTPPH